MTQDDRSDRTRLRCQRVVTPDGVLESAVLTVTGGRITAITAAGTAPGPDLGGPGASAADVSAADVPGADLVRSDLPGTESVPGWTVPGFVDTHVHGGGGADYASTDPDEVLRARRFHQRHGTTSTFASLVTADVDTLCAQIATLAPLVESGELSGIHLEGPFLSADRRGAHQADLLRAPETGLVDRLLDAGRGTIAMITIAPELPGGLAAIQRVAEAGVVAAVGHTDGDEQVIARALDAGATVATHLFNAMRPVHHRTPGPVPRLLSDDRAVVELICDGFHLHPDVVAMAVAAAGPDRVALVTDAMLAAGAPDGAYRLGGLEVAVADGQARLVEPDGGLGSIAGSTLTMARAFAFVVGTGQPVPDVARMAATTPARQHRLDSVGEVRVGGWADLCVLDDHGRLQRVMHRGRWADRS